MEVQCIYIIQCVLCIQCIEGIVIGQPYMCHEIDLSILFVIEF